MSQRKQTSRRGYLKAAGLSLGMATIAGCTGGNDGSGSDGGSSDGDSGNTDSNGDGGSSGGTKTSDTKKLADKLTIATWGGSYGDAIIESFVRPFEDEFGVSMQTVKFGDVWDQYSKIESGSSGVDVLAGSNGSLYTAIQEGYVREIRLDNVPLHENVREAWLNPKSDPGDKVHQIPKDLVAQGVYWRDDKLPQPKKWDDMYTEETKGKVTLLNVIQDLVFPLALDIGHFEEVSNLREEENYDSVMKPVWDRLREVKPYVGMFGSYTSVQTQVSQGNMWTGNLLYGFVKSLQDQGTSVKYRIPDEGGTAGITPYHVTKGTEDPERYTAEQFLNFMLREEPSIQFAKKSGYAQPLKYSALEDYYSDHPVMNAIDRTVALDPIVMQRFAKQFKKDFQKIARS